MKASDNIRWLDGSTFELPAGAEPMAGDFDDQPPAPQKRQADTPSTEKPEIVLREGTRARIVRDLAYAFAVGDAPYYRRDALLVRAITLPEIGRAHVCTPVTNA